jgi:hypothetical protein
MAEYVWSQPERRDLYLASRVLAEGQLDGDWMQWASDVLLQDSELYSDPRQGVGSWLFDDEVQLATELGERLWSAVQANPFSAAEKLANSASQPVRNAATKLVARIRANGRHGIR